MKPPRPPSSLLRLPSGNSRGQHAEPGPDKTPLPPVSSCREPARRGSNSAGPHEPREAVEREQRHGLQRRRGVLVGATAGSGLVEQHFPTSSGWSPMPEPRAQQVRLLGVCPLAGGSGRRAARRRAARHQVVEGGLAVVGAAAGWISMRRRLLLRRPLRCVERRRQLREGLQEWVAVGHPRGGCRRHRLVGVPPPVRCGDGGRHARSRLPSPGRVPALLLLLLLQEGKQRRAVAGGLRLACLHIL